MSSFKERDNSCSRKSRNDDNNKKVFYIANNLSDHISLWKNYEPPATVTNKKSKIYTYMLM